LDDWQDIDAAVVQLIFTVLIDKYGFEVRCLQDLLATNHPPLTPASALFLLLPHFVTAYTYIK
jgi:hypothetical protein